MKTVQPECDLNVAMAKLLDKYDVAPTRQWRLLNEQRQADASHNGKLTLLPGWLLGDAEPSDNVVPLFPWRHERRFIELKQIVDNNTIEQLLTCRFACLTDGESMPLEAILYREFDLAEWIVGSPIVSIFASINRGQSANIIARLANDVVCGIEAGVTLPARSTPIDRHELIARRGVASDQTVDTQVPQSSVYAFTENGSSCYTDTDAELFGLAAEEINLVRAAFDAFGHDDCERSFRLEHSRLQRLVRLAFESDRQCRTRVVEGGES